MVMSAGSSSSDSTWKNFKRRAFRLRSCKITTPGHYQAWLVGVMRGLIWDVVVDIRPGSATFGESCSVELSDMNGRLLWVPPGFAHGFCVLDDTPADLLYKVDTPYNPDGEAGILWSDQTLNIPWPIRDPIVSTRDQAMPTFAAHRLSHAM
jgi:dTDP-4-dehydrorhamnose 3,5-epimerase